eukprot:TRINITY_DN11584_c0_g1_i1.p1 TRINITY_DN11584_c0_g1~~TRINITY_DN11584_c0_g1_i1.p1  ORF type:complete len:1265 (-),score=164.28 TRINITY_DN11584_c0_g1_i1:191-3985(-)
MRQAYLIALCCTHLVVTSIDAQAHGDAIWKVSCADTPGLETRCGELAIFCTNAVSTLSDQNGLQFLRDHCQATCGYCAPDSMQAPPPSRSEESEPTWWDAVSQRSRSYFDAAYDWVTKRLRFWKAAILDGNADEFERVVASAGPCSGEDCSLVYSVINLYIKQAMINLTDQAIAEFRIAVRLDGDSLHATLLLKSRGGQDKMLHTEDTHGAYLSSPQVKQLTDNSLSLEPKLAHRNQMIGTFEIIDVDGVLWAAEKQSHFLPDTLPERRFTKAFNTAALKMNSSKQTWSFLDTAFSIIFGRPCPHFLGAQQEALFGIPGELHGLRLSIGSPPEVVGLGTSKMGGGFLEGMTGVTQLTCTPDRLLSGSCRFVMLHAAKALECFMAKSSVSSEFCWSFLYHVHRIVRTRIPTLYEMCPTAPAAILWLTVEDVRIERGPDMIAVGDIILGGVLLRTGVREGIVRDHCSLTWLRLFQQHLQADVPVFMELRQWIRNFVIGSIIGLLGNIASLHLAALLEAVSVAVQARDGGAPLWQGSHSVGIDLSGWVQMPATGLLLPLAQRLENATWSAVPVPMFRTIVDVELVDALHIFPWQEWFTVDETEATDENSSTSDAMNHSDDNSLTTSAAEYEATEVEVGSTDNHTNLSGAEMNGSTENGTDLLGAEENGSTENGTDLLGAEENQSTENGTDLLRAEENGSTENGTNLSAAVNAPSDNNTEANRSSENVAHSASPPLVTIGEGSSFVCLEFGTNIVTLHVRAGNASLFHFQPLHENTTSFRDTPWWLQDGILMTAPEHLQTVSVTLWANWKAIWCSLVVGDVGERARWPDDVRLQSVAGPRIHSAGEDADVATQLKCTHGRTVLDLKVNGSAVLVAVLPQWSRAAEDAFASQKQRENKGEEKGEESQHDGEHGEREGAQSSEGPEDKLAHIAVLTLRSTFKVECPAHFSLLPAVPAIDDKQIQPMIKNYTRMLDAAVGSAIRAKEEDFFQCIRSRVPLGICARMLNQEMDIMQMTCMAFCSWHTVFGVAQDSAELYYKVLTELLDRYPGHIQRGLCFESYSLHAMVLAFDRMELMARLIQAGRLSAPNHTLRMAFNTTFLHWLAFYRARKFLPQDFWGPKIPWVESLDLGDSFGRTPLMVSLAVGHGALSEELMAEGADTESENEFGETAASLIEDDLLRSRYAQFRVAGEDSYDRDRPGAWKQNRCARIFKRVGCSWVTSPSARERKMLRKCYHRLSKESHPDKCSPAMREKCERASMEVNWCYHQVK